MCCCTQKHYISHLLPEMPSTLLFFTFFLSQHSPSLLSTVLKQFALVVWHYMYVKLTHLYTQINNFSFNIQSMYLFMKGESIKDQKQQLKHIVFFGKQQMMSFICPLGCSISFSCLVSNRLTYPTGYQQEETCCCHGETQDFGIYYIILNHTSDVQGLLLTLHRSLGSYNCSGCWGSNYCKLPARKVSHPLFCSLEDLPRNMYA